jgi:hypothetical protein
MLYAGMGFLTLAMAALILGFAAGVPGLAGVVSVSLLMGLVLSVAGAATLGHHHRIHHRHAYR